MVSAPPLSVEAFEFRTELDITADLPYGHVPSLAGRSVTVSVQLTDEEARTWLRTLFGVREEELDALMVGGLLAADEFASRQEA